MPVRDTQTDKPVGFYGPIAPPVPNSPSSRICGQDPRNDADVTSLDPHIVVDRSTTPRRRFNYIIPASVVLLQQCHYRNRHIGANFKMYLLRQFCSNRVEFFLQYTNTQETQTQKMMDQNFKFEFCDFLEFFLKFSKRRRAVPLRPIWIIMAAAKLDQSRVLVTRFRLSLIHI